MSPECAAAVRILGNGRTYKDQLLNPAAVAALSTPILGIVGGEDDFLTNMQELKMIRPATRLVVVPGTTHGGEKGILGNGGTVLEIVSFLLGNRMVPR
jgi:hypothetical protein